MKKHGKPMIATLVVFVAASLLIASAGLAPSARAGGTPQGSTMQKVGTVAVRLANVRGGPGVSYPALGQLKQGEIVDIVARQESWYQIVYAGATSGTAWVRVDYI